MKNFLIAIMLLSGVVQAQDYYKSSEWSIYNYDRITNKFSKVGTKKSDTRVIVSKDYFALEKEDGKFIMDLWDYVHTDTLGQWFVPRNQDGSICVGTQDSTIYVFSHYDETIEKFTAVTALRKIRIVEPFKAIP